MLSNAYFYYQLTRKYVILFGNMFNNITLMRKSKTSGLEIERIKVPLIYAPKEKYIARLASDPDLQREIQAVLPRMSFEITNISYDSTRKQNSILKNARANTSSQFSSQYMGVPYDLGFELNIYTRNIDDGTHIIEQILPYFNPDYTVTVNPISELGFTKDIPIILTSVSNTVEHEGNFDAVRYVTWNLQFNMKAHYYGPISQQKIIRKIDTNIYQDPTIKSGNTVKLIVDELLANSNFKIDDVVYQGNNYEEATAYGIVSSWSNVTNKLTLTAAQGQFFTNTTIHSVETAASCNVASFDATPVKLVNVHIEPLPNTANPGDDFGYNTTITEWPDTE